MSQILVQRERLWSDMKHGVSVFKEQTLEHSAE